MVVDLDPKEISLLITFCDEEIAKCDRAIELAETIFESAIKLNKIKYTDLKKKFVKALEK